MIRNALSIIRHRGVATLLTAVWSLVRGRYRRLVYRDRFVERSIHGSRMLLDLDDRGISRTLLLFGSREEEHRLIIEDLIVPGMTIYDIGANIGYYALMERRLLGSRGRVIAVEPSPRNVELLRLNLQRNGFHDVPVCQAAVSDRSGRRHLFLSSATNLNTFHATGTGVTALSGESIEVDVLTIEDLSRLFGPPDLIRMDVEGHEVEVMSGLIEPVSKGWMSPTILFETHISRYDAEHDVIPVLRSLFSLGYMVDYLASSSDRGTRLIQERGYRGSPPIPTDDVRRVIFRDIKPGDAVDFIAREGGARTVVLRRS